MFVEMLVTFYMLRFENDFDCLQYFLKNVKAAFTEVYAIQHAVDVCLGLSTYLHNDQGNL